MNSIIKSIKKHRIIVENLISLLGVQFANYFLQLLTFPYLVRTLGISGFGQYTFVFSFTMYFIVITDYGFNLTATRRISIARDNNKEISEIFSAVMVIKLLLFMACTIIMLSLVMVFPKFKSNALIYLVSLLGVFGNFIFPVWYYQGIEKTKYIAIFNAVARLLTVASIFIFIKSEKDIVLAVTIQSLGVVFAGIISLFVMAKYWPVEIIIPTRDQIGNAWKDGWNVFVTMLAATLVNNTNIFILGLLTTNQTVGYFSIADKIVRIFHSLVSPISTAIFPHVSKLFNESKEKATHFLRIVLLVGGSIFALCSLFIVVFSGWLVKLVTGVMTPHIQTIVLILAILPLSIFVDNIYGQQILINIGCTKGLMKAILIPGLASVLLSVMLVPIFKEYATAVIFLMSEVAILTLMIYFVRQKGIYLFAFKNTAFK